MKVIERAMGRLYNQHQLGQKHSTGAREIVTGRVLKQNLNNSDYSTVVTLNKEKLADSLPPQPILGRKVAQLKKEYLITIDDHVGNTSDEYRRIKRPLLDNAFGQSGIAVDRGNLIMVTSSLPGEGKTYTSINLALSMAMERNYTVLLVDSDVAKSDVSWFYGLETQSGLMDLLLDDQLDVSKVLVRTDSPNLSVLPSGRRHSHATELLASKKMSDLLNEMAHRYPDRILIFDSPPLLGTTEAQVLTGLMGQIVVVAAAGFTSQQIVRETIATIDPSKVIGLVLNKTRKFSRANPYSDYKRYGNNE
jgi:protein-tyrosine kinase